MKSWLSAILFTAVLLMNFPGFAQITIGTVDPGPYTPGSTITAPFDIAPGQCIGTNNVFTLYLSDASGVFAPGTPIGTYTGFYGAFVNGVIPATAAAGTGYKLQIRSSDPALSTTLPGNIVIAAGTPGQASVSANKPLNSPEAFGFCAGQTGANADIIFLNTSTAGGVVTATVDNELTGTAEAPLVFGGGNVTFRPANAHYRITVKNVRPGGFVATKSYFVINNNVINSFTTNNSPFVCLPGGSLKYFIDINAANGVKSNFPGNTYRIDWGDGSPPSIYRFCDLQAGFVEHFYNQSSCGQTYQSGNSIINNVFGINVNVQSPFCSNPGTQISTIAKVVLLTENRFTVPPGGGCTGNELIFNNDSVLGQNPDSNGPDCQDLTVRFNWYVDNVLVLANVPISTPLAHTFTVHGNHTIRLESVSQTNCQGASLTRTICIQDPPNPSFTLPLTTHCGPYSFKPTNTTPALDNICSTGNFNWLVIPPAGITVTGASSQDFEPTINLTQAGVYTIRMWVTTLNCGNSAFIDHEIRIQDAKTVELSPDATLCTPGVYNFSSATGPTHTSYTPATNLGETFTWSVSGGSFAFVNGTDLNSQFPSIKFDDYTAYTVRVTVNNDCGPSNDTQLITFIQSPVVAAGQDQSICNTANVTLAGSVTGAFTSYEWVGGAGTFTPGRNDLNAVYAPAPAERAAGTVTLTLRATTPLAPPCNVINDAIVVTIYPENSGASTAASICSGGTASRTLTSAIAGSTFSWTAANPDGNATGFSANGTGNISEAITNTSSVATATVVYTITATGGGCSGPPFTFTVTVYPKPVLNAAPALASICSNTGTNIQLSTGIPGTTYQWTSTLLTGMITGNTNPPAATSDPVLNDLLINTSNADATIRYTITAFGPGNCASDPVTVELTVYPGITIANAGADRALCNETSVQLSANIPQVGTGQWSVISGAGASLDDASKPNAVLSGLASGQAYTLRWTITGGNNCSNADDVVLTNYPAIAANAITQPTATIYCSGQNISINGSSPSGGNGTYIYSWEQSTDNGANWSVIAGQGAMNLTYTITASVQIRRIVTSSACSSVSNVVILTSLPPIANNTITGTGTICTGTAPGTITGSNPTGGDGANYAYVWEQSTDSGINFTIITGANGRDYTPPPITTATIFRRRVSSGACSGSSDNVSPGFTISTNPDAVARFNASTLVACAPFALSSQNITPVTNPANASYSWFADNVAIGTGPAFPGHTITSPGTTVTIKLVTTSASGCKTDTFIQDFSTYNTFTTAFTQTPSSGCGPLTVNFTNTSSGEPGVTYFWDFGNGTTSSQQNPPAVTFLSAADGEDITYTVTLTAATRCGPVTNTAAVLVKANALAAFSPDKTTGCSPLNVNFTNTSKGGNLTYTYDFGDGSPLVTTTSQADISHVYTVTEVTDFVVTMTAANECTTSRSTSIIRVAPNTITPELVVNGNNRRGCAPYTVTFTNNTKGANTFIYNFKDGSTIQTFFAPETVAHTFTVPGTYVVELYATNGCSVATTTETIVVLEQPFVAFTADKTITCPNTPVRFKNNSVNGISYVWDFGDGSSSTAFEPTHNYTTGGASYTVTLTAFNSLGCPNTTVLNNYINVVVPPVTNFQVNPANEITIPDKTFSFIDQSTGDPVAYAWEFGDGATSPVRNPTHTYKDPGIYTVRLTTTNREGCTASRSQAVTIVAVPGNLILPNAFMPGSQKAELRTFQAKGTGIKEWKLTILNKWGQVLWETTALDPGNGPTADGWDGTFNGVPQPQGTYYWKAEVKFINGTEWKGVSLGNSPPKKTGVIYLIR